MTAQPSSGRHVAHVRLPGDESSGGGTSDAGTSSAQPSPLQDSSPQGSSSAGEKDEQATEDPFSEPTILGGPKAGQWALAPSRGSGHIKLSNAPSRFDKMRAAVFRAERRQVLRELRAKYATAEWYADVTGKVEQLTDVSQYVADMKRKAFSDLDVPENIAPPSGAVRAVRAATRFKQEEREQLVDQRQHWWAVPKPVRAAAGRFDELHHRRSKTAHRLHGAYLREGEDALRYNGALRKQIKTVASTRYVEPTKAPQKVKVYAKKAATVVRAAPPPKSAGPWWPGIWAPRKQWCDGRDYYDHAAVRQQRFNIDWDGAIQQVNLIKVIMRADDGDDDGVEDEDGDGIPDEVEEVGDLLWEHEDFLYSVFLSYATLDGSVTSIDFNEFTKCMADLRLASNKFKHAKPRDLDRLFVTINTGTTNALKKALAASSALKGAEKKDLDRFKSAAQRDEAKALTRVEFYGMLVHLAIMRFVLNGELADVSQAVHKLILDLRLQCQPAMCVEADVFRRRHCYTEDVTRLLGSRETSLRNIFAGVASGGHIGASAKLLSLEEWEEFIKALGFVGPDISERDMRFAFVWSRMCVIDERTERGFLRACCLPFEGFLEALCRVAVLKALPTDEEIEESGCKHAGEYFEWVREFDEEHYKNMLARRGSAWGDEPPTPENTANALGKTIDVMFHIIERATTGADEGKVRQSEVVQFLKKNNLHV